MATLWSQRSTGSLVSIDAVMYNLSITIFATDHDSATNHRNHGGGFQQKQNLFIYFRKKYEIIKTSAAPTHIQNVFKTSPNNIIPETFIICLVMVLHTIVIWYFLECLLGDDNNRRSCYQESKNNFQLQIISLHLWVSFIWYIFGDFHLLHRLWTSFRL